MRLVICALFCEAKPIIEKLSLLKTNILDAFEIFASKDTFLIISGIGKLNSAIATTALINSLKDKFDLSSAVIFNIGICGSKPNLPIGTLVFPVSVSSESTKRKYFPELFVKHSLPEVSLLSAERAIQDPLELKYDCVDMEAHAFFHAASFFLASSQIYCLKIISDHCSNIVCDKQFVSQLTSERTNEILDLISFTQSKLPNKKILEQQELGLLNSIIEKLRLTDYQSNELKQMAVSYKIRTARNFENLLPLIEGIPQNKQEAKQIYSRIQNALLA